MTETSDAQCRVIASGLGLVEAPVPTCDGRLLVASVTRGCVYAVNVESAQVDVLVEVGGTPSGLAVAAGGDLYIAQGGKRAEVRSSSSLPTVASLQRFDGTSLVGLAAQDVDCPNDCVLGPDERIWFTDPKGQALASESKPGRVCSYDPLTGRVEAHADGLCYPNGLAFSPDGAWLYVAETAGARITRFGWDGTTLSRGQLFCATPGRPDGLAVDEEGTLFAALVTEDRIVAISTSGKLDDWAELPPGAFPTSLCVGPRPGSTFYVTAGRGGRIFELNWTGPPNPCRPRTQGFTACSPADLDVRH